MTDQLAKRRRGAVLEEVLLEAAWTELAAHGYSDFTMESVAKRAGASRPVIYRRWPTRVSLAAAAISHYVKANPLSVADMGGVRDELCLLLRKFADRAPPRLMRLLFEMTDDMAAAQDNFTHERFPQDALEAIIDRGVARGEIDPARLTPRIIYAPVSLVQHEIAVTAKQITDQAIHEIVDQIFMPLVRPARPAEPWAGRPALKPTAGSSKPTTK
uniref:Transcriptional regulator, TetR family n=1 Tax=Caulobacter sp. (strain K31) TaxID=366602 RepID=B0T5I8_CAUSK